MNLKDQLDALLDATAFDSTGAKIGAVRQVYVDDASGKITFATVATGIFSADAIVPLHGARLLDDELHVDHTRAVIRDSPRPDNTEDALTPEQEAKLLEYYGIETSTRLRGTAAQSSGPAADAAPGSARGAAKGASAGAAKGAGKSASAATTGKAAATGPTGGAKTAGTGPTSAATTAGTDATGSATTTGAGRAATATTSDAGAKPGAGADTAAGPASARRDDEEAARRGDKESTTTTKATDGDPAADSPAPAKASGPGPATPAGTPSEETGGKGPEPRRG